MKAARLHLASARLGSVPPPASWPLVLCSTAGLQRAWLETWWHKCSYAKLWWCHYTACCFSIRPVGFLWVLPQCCVKNLQISKILFSLVNKRLFNPVSLNVLYVSGGVQIVKVCSLTEGKEESVSVVQRSQWHSRHWRLHPSRGLGLALCWPGEVVQIESSRLPEKVHTLGGISE